MSVSLPVVALRAPGVSSALLGRRLARVGFGAVLALAPAIVAAGWLSRGESVLHTAPLIALVWVAAALVAVVAGRFGRSRAALAQFDAGAFAVASFVAPAVGVAVAGPLSLHASIGLPLWLLGVLTEDPSLVGSFDYWVGLSLWGTLHVHFAFAIAMALAARRLAAGDHATRVRVWPAVLLSVVPGILLIFPPFLVLGTGIILAEAFLAVARAWWRDDQAMAAAG
ncbi:MAG: hypothetical protein FJ137_00255 [Deltaproteobacteria bacterium]|nr:hypothetical protein [Deltaproteobacteria bacterium]